MAGAKSWLSIEAPGGAAGTSADSVPPFSAAASSFPNPVDAALEAFFAPRCRVFAANPESRHCSAAVPHLCVAFSGGRDSVVLLDALSRLPLLARRGVVLSALHVHHGLSPHADAWVDFCARFCAARGIPLAVAAVTIPPRARRGLEAAAREARYRVFAGHDCDWLALAHHADDQAETLLLNLLRGAGVQGAAAMPEERVLNIFSPSSGTAKRLLRPFLPLSRAMLEAYAQTRGLSWIDDESNADSGFTRNYLRREIIPLLTARFPAAVRTLARSAAHFTEGAELLALAADEDHQIASANENALIRACFLSLPPVRARNLLRHEFLRRGQRPPPARWLNEALRQLRDAAADSQLRLAHEAVEIRLYRGVIHFLSLPRLIPAPGRWRGEMELPWDSGNVHGRIRFVATEGAGLSRAMLQAAPVRLMPRRGGESLRLDPAASRRSLKNLLREAALPPWERAALPFLWCGDRLAWIGGIGSDCAFRCPPGAPGIEPVWEKGPGDPQEFPDAWMSRGQYE